MTTAGVGTVSRCVAEEVVLQNAAKCHARPRCIFKCEEGGKEGGTCFHVPQDGVGGWLCRSYFDYWVYHDFMIEVVINLQ